MIPLGPVVARSRTKASRATVWAHLTDPDLRSQWWSALEFEAGLGGAVRSIAVAGDAAEAAGSSDDTSTGEAAGVGFGEAADLGDEADFGDEADPGDEAANVPAAARELAGVVDVWVAGHALGFTWSVADEERGTAVLVTLRSQGYHTGVTVTETGFDGVKDGAARADLAGREWARFVEALATASLVEVDLPDGTGANLAGATAVGGVPVAAAAGAAASGSASSAGVSAEGVDSAGVDSAGVGVGDDGSSGDAPANDSADADAAQSDDASESANTSARPETSELELAPDELHGEIAAEAEAAPIEVDAEPNVGDHLELVTGPIELPSDEPQSENLVPLVLPEPHEIPLVLPEPPGDILSGGEASHTNASDADTVVLERVAPVAAESEAPGTADVASEDEEDEPDEPDFDSLLRGLL